MSRKSMRVRICTALAILCIGAFFVFLLLAVETSLTSDKAYAQNLIRLHVVAHSNSPKDQDLKLLVRDAVLQETRQLLGDIEDKQKAQTVLMLHNQDLKERAQKVVWDQGFDYPVQVHIGNFAFPTRDYATFTLPEGWYDAVRIEIGNAAGDNWWCVLFPPLCLGEAQTMDSNLVKISHEETGNKLAFRLKIWDQFSQTQYAQTLQKWWQASAAGFSTIAK